MATLARERGDAGAAPTQPPLVGEVRRFNRFYTRRIGLLEENLFHSALTLAEARVIWELAQHEHTTAKQLSRELGLDPGYLSRILRRIHRRRLVQRERSSTDRRQLRLSLTERGRAVYADLDAASQQQIRRLLADLPAAEQGRLVRAMHDIEELLGARQENGAPYILRPHHTGDMGWVVQSHAVLYGREFGWGEDFEALVAEIVAAFLREHDPKRERCWIAEKDGSNVGSVLLVRHPEREGVAKLRLLLVDPRARGLGIGQRLVQECSRFARQAGYRRITLWTNSVLHAARAIYEKEGYALVEEKPHHRFGHDLVGQTWELELQPPG
jgi:DNA-binding MarR family transcriptional regulator/GNAT superfamily N-acetyltransferase